MYYYCSFCGNEGDSSQCGHLCSTCKMGYLMASALKRESITYGSNSYQEEWSCGGKTS